jgi:hypothetical protein
MEQYLQLYSKKYTILIGQLNTIHTAHEMELMDSTPIALEHLKVHCKEFLTKTIKYAKTFSKQSSSTFVSSDYELYKIIASMWSVATDEEASMIWKTLYEMFVLSILVFPVVKTTNYNYINILLSLETMETDLTLPELPVLHVMSGTLKETVNLINKERKENKISDNLIERIWEEFQQEEITSMNQMNKLKTKFRDVLKRDEIKYIIDIIKSYFNEAIIAKINGDCERVFSGSKFAAFKKKYRKNQLMAMIQNREMTFPYIRQMFDESGILELVGSNFEFPMNFEDCKTLVEKYSGQKIEGSDIKSLLNNNLSKLLEVPQVKKFIKESGYRDMLDPILGMFAPPADHSKANEKRKKKRMKKKMKKLMKENAE